MKLHANAALSPERGQLRVDRVAEGARRRRGAGRQRSDCMQLACALSRGRASRPIDGPSAPNVVATRTDEQTIEAIAGLRRLRFNGPEIAEVAERPVSTWQGSSPGSRWASWHYRYNRHRRLSHRPTRPISCLNNLLGSYN